MLFQAIERYTQKAGTASFITDLYEDTMVDCIKCTGCQEVCCGIGARHAPSFISCDGTAPPPPLPPGQQGGAVPKWGHHHGGTMSGPPTSHAY